MDIINICLFRQFRCFFFSYFVQRSPYVFCLYALGVYFNPRAQLTILLFICFFFLLIFLNCFIFLFAHLFDLASFYLLLPIKLISPELFFFYSFVSLFSISTDLYWFIVFFSLFYELEFMQNRKQPRHTHMDKTPKHD